MANTVYYLNNSLLIDIQYLFPLPELPISINLTISGVDEAYFDNVLKDALEQTVADVNNIPVTAVNADYVGSVSTRSIDNTAVINVTITPENSDQEAAVLEKVGYSNVFVSEVNAELEAYNTTVDSVSDIERIITYTG